MNTMTFSRLLGSLFSTSARSQSSKPTSPVRADPVAAPIIVGQGGRNERQLNVAGQAMLFRDEGGVVVQFRPAFDFELKQTSVGLKLMPSLTPHWEVLREHAGSLRDAIAVAIRDAQLPASEGGQMTSAPQRAETAPRQVRRPDDAVVEAVVLSTGPQQSGSARSAERPRYGVLQEWGEKEFPDGKRPGKTYESFCITLHHRGGIDVLQGEGLRDAIAEANCKLGDRIEVKRLGKTKVPAVDKHGRPKLDASGAQVLWDKWLWSIKKS
ncbi:hypothetical protein [Caballeronia sp. LZ043]|uniref:hypothetical protein n=1 Tax=Caballeronia sp. LZ043 TaxID=3038569 RepID=UPI00285C1689|nr:hypothetical protein [Caballeronia sp. LZ043]MDR5826018.1 hypothetical protein [Caballeronia sp. LZ043]